MSAMRCRVTRCTSPRIVCVVFVMFIVELKSVSLSVLFHVSLSVLFPVSLSVLLPV